MKLNFTTKILVALTVVLFSFLTWKFSGQKNSTPTKLVTFAGGIRDVAIGADGSLLVSGEYSRELRDDTQIAYISPAGDLQLIAPKGWNGNVERVNFSPDGRRALGASGWGVWIGEIKNGQIVRHQVTPAQVAGTQHYWKLRATGQPFWQRDGTIVCISRGDFGMGPLKVARWNGNNAKFLSEKAINFTRRDNLFFAGATISPDGTLVVVNWGGSKDDAAIASGISELWDLKNAKKLRALEVVKPQGLGHMIFSPDSKLIAASDDNGIGYIWETKTGELVQTLSGLRHRTQSNNSVYQGFAFLGLSHGASLAISPDSRTLFAALNDSEVLSYDLETGLAQEVVARLNKPTRLVGCSPDGQQLYAVVSENRGSTLYAFKTPRQTAATP
jgi:WD40 repeat protein